MTDPLQGAKRDAKTVLENNPWHKVSDRDPMAVDIYERHYSVRNYKDGRRNRRQKGFVGPGEKCVLMTTDGRALFAWRHSLIVDKGNPEGVCCTVFRNEGEAKSSELILWAEEYARSLWPGEQLYTWVWDSKVKSKNPGYCFKVAGWKAIRRNKDGRLTLLTKAALAAAPNAPADATDAASPRQGWSEPDDRNDESDALTDDVDNRNGYAGDEVGSDG